MLSWKLKSSSWCPERIATVPDFLINGLMTHMLQFDEGKFTDVLIHAFESYGVKDAMLKIVYPFLKRIRCCGRPMMYLPHRNICIRHHP